MCACKMHITGMYVCSVGVVYVVNDMYVVRDFTTHLPYM